MGDGTNKRLTYISANIDPVLRIEVINLLREYKDCFAWDYNEITGLSRDLVELKLPIKPGKNPNQAMAKTVCTRSYVQNKRGYQKTHKMKFYKDNKVG